MKTLTAREPASGKLEKSSDRLLFFDKHAKMKRREEKLRKRIGERLINL
jgi:hypothetical protein